MVLEKMVRAIPVTHLQPITERHLTLTNVVEENSMDFLSSWRRCMVNL